VRVAATPAGRRLVLLNGPAGIGKTAIGRRLAQRAPSGACIGGDELKSFVVRRDDPSVVSLGLSYLGGAALADVFLRAGYELVVFEHARQVQRFAAALSSAHHPCLLTLWAPLDVVIARHRRRDRVGQDEQRARACWETMSANLPELGQIIDASGDTERTLSEVIAVTTAGA
jgi:hypothetical protein